MNGMDELIAFLRARLDEDVKVARDATFWTGGVPEWTARAEPDGVHIARHDPARVLADVAAKRRIIAEYAGRDQDVDLMLGRYTERQGQWAGLHLAVRLLALPYAGHPDYREEWKP
jgi:hypothetical protein